MDKAQTHNKEILKELVTALEGLSDEPLLLAPYLAGAFYRAAGERGADSSLLSIIGSWGDTLPDEEVLAMLKEWNTGERLGQGNKKSPTWARVGRSGYFFSCSSIVSVGDCLMGSDAGGGGGGGGAGRLFPSFVSSANSITSFSRPVA